MKNFTWKLQENAIDKNQNRLLINFIKSSNKFTQGSRVSQFEKAWSKWQGCKYSVFVNSGSSANLVILDLLKDYYHWEKDDEIIVPAVTWITDISTLLQFGLKPIFVDINLKDFSFDYEQLRKKITKKTKAIFVTHLMGFPANISKIKEIIKKTGIVLIEDCCESHGAMIKNRKVGSFGICSSFSFFWGHHMTTIEGGMVCTNNQKIYHLALLKRSHGLARELPKKFHPFYKKKFPNIDFNFLFLTTGFNVRNTELGGVLGFFQVKKLDKYIKIRNNNYRQFTKILRKYQNHFVLPDEVGISSFCLPFILKSSPVKDKLEAYLIKNGIECRPIISGNLLRQPFLNHYSVKNHYPNADFVHNHGFYIGNNQFVNIRRMAFLDKLLESFFNKI